MVNALLLCIILSLFVQLLLSSLALLLGALFWRHVLGHGRAWMSLVRSKLGVDGGVVLDGLDGELLLALGELRVSDSACQRLSIDETMNARHTSFFCWLLPESMLICFETNVLLVYGFMISRL